MRKGWGFYTIIDCKDLPPYLKEDKFFRVKVTIKELPTKRKVSVLR